MALKDVTGTIGVQKEEATYNKHLLIALFPPVFISCFFYGLRPLFACVVGSISAYVAEYICLRMRKLPFQGRDMSPLVTGVLLNLLLPANCPYWVIIMGCVVAIALAKQAFGGIGNQIFNPVAVAFVFLSVTCPTLVYSYPNPLQSLPIFFQKGAVELGISPAFTLKRAGVPFFDSLDLFLGNYPGAMGATCTLVIVACGAYLLVKKVITWQIPVTCISTCILFAFFFPRITTGRLDSVFYEVFCGVLFYGVVFLAGDRHTVPVREDAKVLFGICLGLLTMLFHYFGAFEIGFCFALILMNALSGFFDRVLTPFVLNTDWKHVFKATGMAAASLVGKIRETGGEGEIRLPETGVCEPVEEEVFQTEEAPVFQLPKEDNNINVTKVVGKPKEIEFAPYAREWEQEIVATTQKTYKGEK